MALGAAEAAVEEMRKVRGVILPFPGGMVRAGSKVGAKHYKKLRRRRTTRIARRFAGERASRRELPDDVNAVHRNRRGRPGPRRD